MQTQLTVHTELLRFGYSLLPGMFCGLLLECFRTLRALLPHHPFAVFLEDTLFSFLCCFILQCYAWSFCGGVLRWQYALGMLGGVAVWLLTAGAVWARILRRLCGFRQRLGRRLRLFSAGKQKQQESSDKI